MAIRFVLRWRKETFRAEMTKQLYKEHPGEQRNHVKMQSITFNLTEITYKEVNCGFLQLSTFLSFSL